MAKFNQDVQKSSDPSYIGYSKEGDRPKSNNAVGAALSNLADLGKGIVGAVDSGIKQQIENAVYDGTDPLRNAQGVDAAVSNLPNPLRPDLGQLPDRVTDYPQNASGKRDSNTSTTSPSPEIQKYNRSIRDLTSAYQQGTLDPGYYYTQLEAMSRQIRSRFPGYRAEVDATVQNITGVNPANAVMKTVVMKMQEAEAKRQANVDEWGKFEEKNAADITRIYGPGYWKSDRSGIDKNEVKAGVYGLQGNEAQMKAHKEELELRAKSNELDTKDVKRLAITDAINDNAMTVNMAGNAVSLQGLRSKIAGLQAAGKTPSPEEQAQITQALNMLEEQARSNALAKLNSLDERHAINGKPRAYYLADQKDRDEVVNAAVSQIQTLKQAVLTGEMSWFGATERLNKARMDTALGTLVENDTFAKLASASKLGMNSVIDSILTNPTFRSKSAKTLAVIFGIESADTPKPNDSQSGITGMVDKLTDQMKRGGNINAKEVDSLLSVPLAPILDQKTTVEAKSNAVKNIYGKKELNLLDKFRTSDGSVDSVYNKLVNPAVTAVISTTFGRNSEEMRAYSNWAETNAMRLNVTAINSVKDVSMDSKMFSIVFNDKTGQFEPQLTIEGEKFKKDYIAGTNPAGSALFRGQTPKWDVLLGSAEGGLNKVNQMLGTLKPIYEANGVDMREKLQLLMNAQGWGVNGEKSKEKGLGAMITEGLGKVGDSVGRWLSETPANPIKGMTSKDSRAWGPKNTEAGVSTTTDVAQTSTPDNVHPILGALAGPESGGNYNRLVFGGSAKEAPLTNMTVAQVMDYQNQMPSQGHASTAVGKYQIIKGTMQWLIDRNFLSPTDKFDEATQEKAAQALLDYKVGFKAYQEGRMSWEVFSSRLQNEWEAVAKSPALQTQMYKIVDRLNKGGGNQLATN